MTVNTRNVSQDLTFEAQGGLFGGSGDGLTWDAFLGVGGKEPVKAPVNLGGAVEIWLPFVGDVEILRMQLLGEIATRIGLALNLEISPGTTTATLPYEVSFSYPDAETLAANPNFRLEGEGVYKEGPSSGFETDWPYFLFSVDAIFELAVLMELYAGILGNNKTFSLLDFDVSAEIPIVNIDTRPGNNPELFGVDFGDIADLSLTYEDEPYIGLPTSFTAEFSGDDIDLLVGPAEDEAEGRKEAAKGAKDDDTDSSDKTADDDKKSNSLLDALEIGQGPLATLTLNIPNIELADRGIGVNAGDGTFVDEELELTDTVSYKDGTREGDFDGTYDDPDFPTLVQDLAELNIDLDNIAVEAIKRALTGGVGVPNTPGLEGSFNLPFDFGPFGAGAYFNYNLIDTDLVFSLPINQTVEVTPDTLQTSLTFYAADTDGNVIETDGMQEATYVTARLPRYSVYFNESNTFWDAGVAAAIQEAMIQNPAAAEDVALFVDFQSGRIPGAFTGESDSIAGGVERRVGNGAWEKLTTNAEETEWLARSEVSTGADPQLDDLTPRGDASFRYVIYGPAGTVLDTIPLDFSTLVAEDGIFEARLDVVNAPLYSTGLLEGVPSFDIFYPGTPGESVWVEVGHKAGAQVSNDTSLDFEMDLVLSALELGLGAYVKAFGARFGLDFSFGPLWEKTIPIVATELTKLYDNEFSISDTSFNTDETTDQENWGFAIGAGGEAAPAYATEGTAEDDLFDGAALLETGGQVDGGAGVDTLSFARLNEGEAIAFDLAKAGVAYPTYDITLTPYTGDPVTNSLFSMGGLAIIDGMDLDISFEVTRTGGADSTVPLAIVLQALDPVSGGFSLRSGDDFSLAEGETGYMWITAVQGDMRLYASTSPTRPATALNEISWNPSNPAATMNFYIRNDFNAPDAGKSLTISNVVARNQGEVVQTSDQVITDGTIPQREVTIDQTNLADAANIENLVGSRGDDELFGDDGANRIEGGEGNDTLDGRDGPDTLVGGLGEDILITGGTSEGRDAVFGGEGDDRLVAGAGAALLDGGEDAPVGSSGGSPADLDIVDYREAPDAIALNLETGEASGPWVADHELRNIEGIAGTAYDDTLTGDNGRSYFEAGDGADILRGDDIGEDLSRAERQALEGRNDRLYGQDGDDTLLADPGADFLDGGAGRDLVDYSDAPTSVFVDFEAGFTIDDAEFTPLLEGTGSDPIDFRRVDGQGWRGWAQGDKYRDVEDLTGSDYEDILFGDAGANLIDGGAGNDRIAGRAGLDTLLGGEGDDVFWTAAQEEYAIDRSVDGQGAGSAPAAAMLSQTLDLRFTMPDADISFMDGGLGTDLAILDWRGGVIVDEDNFYDRNTYTNTQNTTTFPRFGIPPWVERTSSITQTRKATHYESDMRFEVRDLVSVVGDLELGIGSMEFTPEKVTIEEDLYIIGRRDSADWEDINPRLAVDYYDDTYRRNKTEIKVYSDHDSFTNVTRGTFYANFRYKVDNLIMPEAQSVVFADLSNVEGLVGSEFGDILLGSLADNKIYGAGGADIIAARDGDDVVRFGEGQSPEALFSFPGRNLEDISPFSAPDPISDDPNAPEPPQYVSSGEIDNGTFPDTGPGNPGSGGGFVGQGNRTLAPLTFYTTQIEDYLAAGLSDRDALEGLRAALIANRSRDNNETDSDDFLGFSFVDGGADIDTLDLRFDRGLGFLPDGGSDAAVIYLNQNIGTLGDQRAVLLNIENVIGTSNDDRIIGDLENNVIEGSGGADYMNGNGGNDTLSYANADEGITLVLDVSSLGGVRPQFKVRNGSEGDAVGDAAVGFEVFNATEFGDRVGIEHTSATASGETWSENDFELFHAGGGDDIVLSGFGGLVFAGGEGDDRFVVSDALISDGRLYVDGGSGINQINLGQQDMTALVMDDVSGDPRIVTDTGTEITYDKIDYVTAANGTFALNNADASTGGGGALTLVEDAWSEQALFPDALNQPTQGGAVTGLSETGTFFLEGTTGRSAVTLGQDLTAAEVATLVFVPNQSFGALISEDGTQRQNAVLELTFTAENGSVQNRDLAVTPGEFDGQSLGLVTPTDVEHPAQSFSLGELALADGITSAEVAISGLGAARDMDLDASLANSRYGDAQAYRITDISEGGALWLTETTPPADATDLGAYGVARDLAEGDVILRSDFDKLAFAKNFGLIDETDTVSFAPVEQLEILVTETPDAGVVFSPVTALDLTLPGTDDEVMLIAPPTDGTLFYRAEDGTRVEVGVGDTLPRDIVSELLFEIDINRRATLSDAAEIETDFAELNAPTISDGDPGQGATQVPTDPTALSLIFAATAPDITIDGVTVDLAAAGATHAKSIDLGLDWVQWAEEDGGNGHFYAFGSGGEVTQTGINNLVSAWDAQLRGDDANIIPEGGLVELASVADADENAFIYSLFSQNDAAWRGIYGPLIGGVRDGDGWSWTDGSDWTAEFWQAGEPNDVGGDEDFIHYARTVIDAAEGLYLPTWNDVDSTFNVPGFVVEAASLTTEANDRVDGSADGNLIDGAGGSDILNGLDGNDTIRGGTGDDRIDGGMGDDELSGDAGADIFVMARDGGTDRILDFVQGSDRIDVSGLNLSSLSELRMQDGAEGLELHAKDATMILVGKSIADTPLTAADFAGAILHAGTALADASSRALEVGDRINVDELAGLRMRADDNATGDAGSFAWEVQDPWAEPEGLDLLPDATDGIAEGRLNISLTAQNDAPQGVDRAYLVSEGSVLDARDPIIRLQASDAEGDAITFSVVDGPEHGTLEMFDDGGFTYRPDADFQGDPDVSEDDGFTYRVSDGTDSQTYRVSLDIADTSALRTAETTDQDDEGYVRLSGLSSDDFLGGDDGNDFIKAGWGRDIIEGKGGDDRVDGGAGDDTLRPGMGIDEIITGKGADLVSGTPEELHLDHVTDFARGDMLRFTGVSLDVDQIAISQGSAILDVDADGDGTKETKVTLAGDFSEETFVMMTDGADTTLMLADTGAVRLSPAGERFISSDPAANRVFGDGGDDFILAGAGSDMLAGAGGSDELIGDLGDDTLIGGAGNDEMTGGAGADRFTFDAADFTGFGVDTITDFTPGVDQIVLSGFDETTLISLGDIATINTGTGGFIRLEGLTLDQINDGDIIVGPSANFRLLNVSDVQTLTNVDDRYVTEDPANNRVLAQGGNDLVISGDGDDTLDGGSGSDELLGGNGADRIVGGFGNDILTGGADADRFVFTAGETGFIVDTITDFTIGEDIIELSGYGEDLSYLTLNESGTVWLSETEFVTVTGTTETELEAAAADIFEFV